MSEDFTYPVMDLELSYYDEDTLEQIDNLIKNPDIHYELKIKSVDIEEEKINLSITFTKLLRECRDYYVKYGTIYIYMRKDTDYKEFENDCKYKGLFSYRRTCKPYIDEIGERNRLEELMEHFDRMGYQNERVTLFVNTIFDFTNPKQPNLYEVMDTLECLNRNGIKLYSLQEEDYEYYTYLKLLNMLDKVKKREKGIFSRF